jgi:DNA-directed RNA polymerase subunit RPC12/RpoP
MSGYCSVISPCIVCGQIFSYNPHRVPSTSLLTGEREAVCQDCMNRINAKRATMGLPPHEILPGAYDPLPEEEL